MDDESVQRRMLALLMQTARDEALPWTWRAACLEHTLRPRARLARLLQHRDPAELERMAQEAEAMRERLDAALLTGRCVVAQRLGG